MVREALETSVTCTAPLVSFQISQRVHGAEQQFAVVRLLLGVGDILQNPADLAGREIRVDHQPRLARDRRGPRWTPPGSRRTPPCAGIATRWPANTGSPVLAVPHDRGLALIGDPDRGNRSAPDHAGRFQRPPRGIQLRAPDLLRILLHPARLRIAACKRRRLHGGSLALLVIQRGARTGGAFVQCKDRTHRSILSRRSPCTGPPFRAKIGLLENSHLQHQQHQ